MMYESPRSLKVYFYLVGLVSIGYMVFSLYSMLSKEGTINPVQIASGALIIVLSSLYIYMAANIDNLLLRRPGFILSVVGTSLILNILSFSVIGVLINVYLYTSVKRISGRIRNDSSAQAPRRNWAIKELILSIILSCSIFVLPKISIVFLLMIAFYLGILGFMDVIKEKRGVAGILLGISAVTLPFILGYFISPLFNS